MKVAVGFFDGVHLGHRSILAGADAAFTFLNHPLAVLSPGGAPGLLMSAEERIAAIAAALRPGERKVVALPFTEEMRRLPPKDFIAFLKERFPGMDAVRCGSNWRFGVNGAGNVEFARSLGLVVEEAPFVMYAGAAVSSTRIRRALADGDIDGASAMLGRRWSMAGEVFAGKGEGAKLGFPTINLRPLEATVPLRSGVYAVDTELGMGIANWGTAPTMGDAAWKTRTLEVHLKDWREGTLPPRRMTVAFCAFVRGEVAFPSKEALVAQIASDIRSLSVDRPRNLWYNTHTAKGK